jgi:hypothetical protein
MAGAESDTHHVPNDGDGFREALNPSIDCLTGETLNFLSSPVCKNISVPAQPKSLLYPSPSRPA